MVFINHLHIFTTTHGIHKAGQLSDTQYDCLFCKMQNGFALLFFCENPNINRMF